MRKKKLFGFIDKQLLIWFHYLPLVGVIVLAHYTSMLAGLEDLTLTQPVLGWTLIVGWYYAFLLIGDNLIHTILGVD